MTDKPMPEAGGKPERQTTVITIPLASFRYKFETIREPNDLELQRIRKQIIEPFYKEASASINCGPYQKLKFTVNSVERGSIWIDIVIHLVINIPPALAAAPSVEGGLINILDGLLVIYGSEALKKWLGLNKIPADKGLQQVLAHEKKEELFEAVVNGLKTLAKDLGHQSAKKPKNPKEVKIFLVDPNYCRPTINYHTFVGSLASQLLSIAP